MSAMSGGPTIDVHGVNEGIAENAAVVCAQAASSAERGGLKVETPHHQGRSAATRVISVAQEVNADLIVVGNRGHDQRQAVRARQRAQQDLARTLPAAC